MAAPNEDTPQIEFSELLRRLDDDEVSDDLISPYLLHVPSADGGIDPAFEPNPVLVSGLDAGLEGALIVNSLNRRYRRKRRKAYRARIESGWTGPKIVDEGDSWFQYPLRLKDIIDHLMEDHAVLSLSGAGHTLAQMIAQDEVMGTIAQENADALLFSAGGNDLFQDGNIANLIEEVRPGIPARDLVGQKFDDFTVEILGDVRAFLLRIHRAFPRVVILIHGYSAAFSRMDRWIGRPLSRAGVQSRAAQDRVVEVMVERFNAAQKRLADDPEFHGRLVHVDLTDIGTNKDDWFDEIHMNSVSNKAAAGKFATALSTALSTESLLPPIVPDIPTEAVAVHATELMRLDEATLLAELQARIDLIDREPDAAELPSTGLVAFAGGLEAPSTARAGPLAMRLLRRWEREFYDILCGELEEDEKTRNDLRNALGAGQDALIGALTAWLLATPLGLPSLLAGVLAAIIVQRFGGSAVEEICAAWKERLDPTV